MSREEMVQLHNTLAMVETKGESTKIMANCLQFLEQKIREAEMPSEAVPA